MPTKSQNVSGFGPPEESPAGFGPPEDETPEPKKFVPGSLSQQQMDAAWMKKMKSNPPAKSNKPAPFLGKNDADRFKVHVSDDFQENAPAILGVAGAAVGSLGGPVGSVLGATYGGYAGKGIQRDYEEKPRSATAEALGGVEQGAYELGGQVGGRVLGRLARPVIEKYPELFKVLGLTEDAAKTSPKAVGHLTAAASPKGQAGPARDAIAGTIGDIEQKISTLPPKERTVGGFLDAVTRARAAIHEEYGNALGPYAHQEVSTKPIADAIRSLKKPWMDVPGMGAEEKSAIEKAATQFERPMTVGQLDSLRQQLNTDLASLYGKAPNARYTATQGSINNAIDTTIASGARDVLYPIADSAANKPAGYFRDALDREGSLIQLRGILQKRFSDLAGSQAISEVTPRLSSENLSVSLHPGTMPRGGLYGLKNVIAPTRELTQAGKHVAKAFPAHGAVNSLPYQILFSNAPRVASMIGPKSQAIEDMRRDDFGRTP